MKKLLSIILIAVLVTSCYDSNNTAEKTKEAEKNINKNTVFSFDVNNLQEGCSSNSDMVCTINTAVKCTLNPSFSECNKIKNSLPAFIFMQDDSLKRPTFQSYKITKLSPRNDGTVEVYTQSSCNGNWFGLCNGNIVYIMKNINSKWIITDIYAIEF